jgi:hypothetical protein
MDKPIAKLKLLTTKGEVVDAILYCHQETTSIGGTTYYLLKKDTSADASGTTLSASTGSVARVVWGKFVFQLTGIVKILASTIYATYRAYTGGGTVNAEIDILIRKSDGTVRTTIATGVSKSANLGTAWATYTGANYSFAEYTVVDQTDYLEIDYIANVTAKKSGQYAYLRIDDYTLDLADQTRSQDWSFAVPSVVTLGATDVSQTQATLNGKTVAFTATIRGFEWGKQSGNYTDSWTESDSFSEGTYSHTITNLDPNTVYYYRAKAYSPATGWLYGDEQTFDTYQRVPTTVTLWLTATQVGSNTELACKLGLQPSTEGGTSTEFFVASPSLIGIRVWKRSAGGEETEITGGTPVAQADITNLTDGQMNVRTGTWTITSAIPLSPTDKLVVRAYIYTTVWQQLVDPATEKNLVWVSDALNATQINPSTITVYYYIFYSVHLDLEDFNFGNNYSRLENVILSLPTGAVETIVAKNFPMNYLPSPAKATQLTSKISGATITTVSQDYPLTLLKKDKAQELKSKYT